MVAGMPGWGTLLDELISELEVIGKALPIAGRTDLSGLVEAARAAKSVGDYQYVASLLSMHLPPDTIKSHVQSRFSIATGLSPSTQSRVNLRLDSLMRAPVSGVITTNYDNLIESHPKFLDRFTTVALSGVDLPSLFRGRDRTGRYFLKIHGDLNGDIVLSSEDYDRVYLSSPKAENFLRASLMQSPLVFLGCSVEDAILRQRRLLFELYGSGLPPCFQVTARSNTSEVRAAWLYEYAGIQSVFYDASSSEHLEFDPFLEDLTAEMVRRNLQMFGRRPSRIIRQSLGGPLEITEAALGKTNFEILSMVANSSDGQCTYLQLLEAVLHKFPVLEMETMVYRIAFLVSIGALRELPGEELLLAVSDVSSYGAM